MRRASCDGELEHWGPAVRRGSARRWAGPGVGGVVRGVGTVWSRCAAAGEPVAAVAGCYNAYGEFVCPVAVECVEREGGRARLYGASRSCVVECAETIGRVCRGVAVVVPAVTEGKIVVPWRPVPYCCRMQIKHADKTGEPCRLSGRALLWLLCPASGQSPSFLRISFGSACLLTIIEVVL